MQKILDAVYFLSFLVSQHLIQMTDSIKNPFIDFRFLLLSRLPLSAPAKSIRHQGYIDSGKGGCDSMVNVCICSVEMRERVVALDWGKYQCVVMWTLFSRQTVSIDAQMDVCERAFCIKHASGLTYMASGCWGADIDYQVLWSHWSVSTGRKVSIVGRERGWGVGLNTNAGW